MKKEKRKNFVTCSAKTCLIAPENKTIFHTPSPAPSNEDRLSAVNILRKLISNCIHCVGISQIQMSKKIHLEIVTCSAKTCLIAPENKTVFHTQSHK